ncbi:Hypothetical protein Minf_2047 [Methylacidiphilum infernorum V4]|uniref:Uncharacterized protein n=1 Tax=Methylacidiphilum infernorum (isolate V4) TaxID=481448 RepID=B3DZ09_METI4|nr:Hypothetical protein Minf_2047 [Methylacidiphilum infernorum V4]
MKIFFHFDRRWKKPFPRPSFKEKTNPPFFPTCCLKKKNLEAKTRLIEIPPREKSELIPRWLTQNQNPFPNPCFLPREGSRPTRNAPREACFPENKSQVAYPMRHLFLLDHPSFDGQWRKKDHEKDLEG